MRTGAGIAIPLPDDVAKALGLRAGKKVRVEGPDAEGAIRVIPEPDVAAAPPSPAERAPSAPSEPEPPSPKDVARALSKTGPASVNDEETGGFTEELENLVARHGDSLREVET